MKWVFLILQVFTGLIVAGACLVLFGLQNDIGFLYKWGSSGVGMGFPTAVLFLLVSVSLLAISLIVSWLGETVMKLHSGDFVKAQKRNEYVRKSM